MKKLTFRIRELMAEKSRIEKKKYTYQTVQETTGISPNTLSTLATGKAKMVGHSTIERLLDFFECEVADLLVYKEVEARD